MAKYFFLWICILIFKSLWMVLRDFLIIPRHDLLIHGFMMTCNWWVNMIIYIMIYDDVMSMRIWWWLHSTTGSYGRPVIKVVYGETLIHSTEAVWEILAREEWLGCQHDASSMFDIPGSTPVWAQYIYFMDFKDIKTYTYHVFKSICIIKEHWWILTSSWPDEVQRMFSTAHEFSFKRKTKL